MGGGGRARAWPCAAAEEADRASGVVVGGAMGCGAPGRGWRDVGGSPMRGEGEDVGKQGCLEVVVFSFIGGMFFSLNIDSINPTWATTIAVTVGGGTNGILLLPPQRHNRIPMYMDAIMKCKIDDWDIMHIICHSKIGVKPIGGQANLIDRTIRLLDVR
uniref:Uncharacterized protein n=1 Tax=Oryza rufipogon TaxID=4529 RepID=A0A0E0RIG2_ORYRU